MLHEFTDPAGTTSYAYNTNGLLADLADPFSATHALFTYDTAGRIWRRSDGGTKCATQTYETGTGRPDVLTVRKTTACTSGTVLGTFDLGYDAASNVTSRAESITGNSYSGTYTYTYDAAGRMLTASGPAAFGSRTYTWDGASDRTSVKVGSGTPVSTTYDAAGLPTSASDGTTYTHDAAGNLTVIDRPGGSTSDWRYAYSSWGQLTKAERTPGSSDVTFTTDALDRVLQRTSGGTTASFTYAGLGEALARAVVGATSTLYASTPGGPLAQKVGSTVRYYVGDQHGDAVGWTDTTGTLKGTALYDPWGQVLSSTGEMASAPPHGVAFRFQSDLTDASTGQVDMGVRAYEPTLGRFSSPDPLFGDPLSPASLNRFTYAVGNPVTLSDPTGLMPVCGEGCTRQEEAEIIRDYATSFTQAGASEYSPARDQQAKLPPADFERWIAQYREVLHYAPYAKQAAAEFGVDPAVVLGVLLREGSGYSIADGWSRLLDVLTVAVRPRTGSIGLIQMQVRTFQKVTLAYPDRFPQKPLWASWRGWAVHRLTKDPEGSVRYAAAYLRTIGNALLPSDQADLSIWAATYNAGIRNYRMNFVQEGSFGSTADQYRLAFQSDLPYLHAYLWTEAP